MTLKSEKTSKNYYSSRAQICVLLKENNVIFKITSWEPRARKFEHNTSYHHFHCTRLLTYIRIYLVQNVKSCSSSVLLAAAAARAAHLSSSNSSGYKREYLIGTGDRTRGPPPPLLITMFN